MYIPMFFVEYQEVNLEHCELLPTVRNKGNVIYTKRSVFIIARLNSLIENWLKHWLNYYNHVGISTNFTTAHPRTPMSSLWLLRQRQIRERTSSISNICANYEIFAFLRNTPRAATTLYPSFNFPIHSTISTNKLPK